MNELSAGTQLLEGKYTIEGVIGSGGFGITYFARHNVLGNQYAVKEFFIHSFCTRYPQRKTVSFQGVDNATYDKYRQKFIEEAQTLASLTHPNIVRVEEVFQENNTAYIVMPRLQGPTLQEMVDKRGWLQYEEAVNYIAQLSEAVGYIHKKNILHRDIKPDNVVIQPNNIAILIDFGSAKEFIHNQTQAGSIIVTDGYAPPEQYLQRGRKGPFSDIYSLGATFYFALTGEKPMHAAGRTVEEMPIPKKYNLSIPEEANRVIMKAMRIKHDTRYSCIEDFMNDLLNKMPMLAGEGINRDRDRDRRKPKGKGELGDLLLAFGLSAFIVLIIFFVITQYGGVTTWFGDGNGMGCSRIERPLSEDETSRFNEAKEKAKKFYNAAEKDQEQYKHALDWCEEALKIKRNDSVMKDLKKEIKEKIKQQKAH